MPYSLLANLVMVLHLLFVVFVVLGGLLVFWKGWFTWIHLPVAIYGVMIEWIGWVCPLTPLENRLREQAGQAGYKGGFVEEYLLPLVYPEGFTRNVALVLGAVVLAINLAIYSCYLLSDKWRT